MPVTYEDEEAVIVHESRPKEACCAMTLTVLDHPATLSLIVLLVLLDMVVFVLALSETGPASIWRITTLCISSLFLVEIIVRICIIGVAFFRDAFMVIDALVVVASLVVEAAFPTSFGGLVVLFRLIRVLRIMTQLFKHGTRLRQANFAVKKDGRSALEYVILSLRELQHSPHVRRSALPRLEHLIGMLAAGNLHDVDHQDVLPKQMEPELKNFLMKNFSSGILLHRAPRCKQLPGLDLISEDEVDSHCGSVRVSISGSSKRFSVSVSERDREQGAGLGGAPAVLGTSAGGGTHAGVHGTHGGSSHGLVVEVTLKIAQDCRMGDWGCDIFQLHANSNGNALVAAGMWFIQEANLFSSQQFRITRPKVANFLLRIQGKYLATNPYHNALHGADVCASVFYLLHKGGMRKRFNLSDVDVLAALIAAIVHDVEHPGVNNGFLVSAGVPSAVIYNDNAVLENHHVATAFLVLSDPECNVVENLSSDQYRDFRSTMVSTVLSTDMAAHFKHFNEFKTRLSGLDSPAEYASKCGAEDKYKALGHALHMSDVSNPCKPLPLAQRWTMLVQEEFFRQGDLEQAVGIPVSAMFDRKKPSVAKSQIGFITFVVKPYLEMVCSACLAPEAAHELLEYIEANTIYWKAQNPEKGWTLPEEEAQYVSVPPCMTVEEQLAVVSRVWPRIQDTSLQDKLLEYLKNEREKSEAGGSD